ncbi:hypothetical protein HMPREF1345_02087 [Enterococcus faecium TX1337RF]|nr:hypothetical protein HMPREF1345_02087 [Enterococcus faecium TX1337RF]
MKIKCSGLERIQKRKNEEFKKNILFLLTKKKLRSMIDTY